MSSLNQECVVGVYESFGKAKDAVQALERAEYPAEQVSLVTHRIEDEVPDEELLQFGDNAERTAATGAGVGGLIGVLLGTPLVAVGGLGSVLIAGPVAMGLAGAIVGGFLGAMSGWGVHQDHVKEYEKQVAEGAMLVIANGDPLEVAEAERVLQQTDAVGVHRHVETSADAVEP